MKVLKWIIIILLSLITIFLIYSAIQPNKALVKESIEINKPASVIYNDLIDFTRWGNWSPWAKMDPDMKNEYAETMGKVGSYSSWESKNPMVGNGRQELIEMREGEYLKLEMNMAAWPGTKYAELILEERNGVTTVTWLYEGSETPFYLNFMNGMVSSMLSQNYKDGLTNMKEYMESKKVEVENPMNLEVIVVEPIKIISIKDSTNAAGISAKLGELYGELSIYMAMNESMNESGMPLALYYTYSEEKVVLEAALPYDGEAVSQGRIKVSETPSGKVIKGIHLGSYDSTDKMHYAIEEFSKASNLELNGPCWEVYANDPTAVEVEEIETQLFYPVK